MRSAIVVSTLFFVLTGASAQAAPPSWSIENIAPSSSGNRKIGLRTTSDGRVHLAFTGSVDAALKTSVLEYAVRSVDGKWTRTVVDDTKKKTGWFPAMAIDAAGAIHVAYATPHPKMRLYQASLKPGGKWTTRELSKEPGGYWNSLEAGPRGLLLSMTGFPTNDLDEPALDFGDTAHEVWSFERVDMTREAGWMTSLALDAKGLPVITYIRDHYPVGILTLTHKMESGDWVTRTIDRQSVKSSVALDAQGFYHVVYQKYDFETDDLRDLMYATNAPAGEWTTTIVAGAEGNGRDTGGHPSLAIDARGGLHVTFSDEAELQLMYARKLPGKDWEISPITKRKNDGYYSTVRVDSTGAVHVAYDTGREIRYAVCRDCAAER